MPDVFAALSDPTRRHILERLRRNGSLSVSQLAEPLAMSRQAATKHLDLLADSGLVRVSWEGRRRMHALDPEPLEHVQDWLAPFHAEWEARLERLRRHVDGPLDDPDTDETESPER